MCEILLTYSNVRISCGGGIITPKFVLSAAHCFCHERDDAKLSVALNKTLDCGREHVGRDKVATEFGQNEIILHIGSNHLANASLHAPSQVHVHPFYQNDLEPAAFDIAVVCLRERLIFGPSISALLLPTRATLDLGVSVQSAGWGVKRRRTNANAKIHDTCRTNQYGPSQFEVCSSMITYYCEQSNPPNYDERCPEFWSKANSSEDVKIIEVTSGNKVSICYHPDVTRYGWCRTSESDDSWGLCMRSCQFRPGSGRKEEGQDLEVANFQTLPEGKSCYDGRLDKDRELCMAGQFLTTEVAHFEESPSGSLQMLEKEIGGAGNGVYGFRDSCQGDSGSPVWKWVEESYGTRHRGRRKVATFVGIISRGVGCADKNSIGVVTRVKQHLGWIRDVTRLRSIEISSSNKRDSSSSSHRIQGATVMLLMSAMILLLLLA